jgi:predicted MFS family arabinose efflux permease
MDERSGMNTTATPGTPVGSPSGSTWAPLGIPVFRALWIAAFASNIGSWMHIVAASWLMTSLTTSAALVALLQTANSAPNFLLALPAGALADVLDRRRLVLFSQLWQLLVASALGVLTLTGSTDPVALLVMSFALAAGSALGVPAFSALTPELVPRPQLPAAISLNSIILTGSQAVGPAIGGVLVASLGAGAVFVVNAVSFLAVVTVVAGWRRPQRAPGLPPEHVTSAIRTGLRYVANAPAFRAVLIRAGAYVFSFSALPALLAVFVRLRLNGTAADYGLLLGASGVGGIAGALILPRVRSRWRADHIVTAAALLYAAGLAAITVVPRTWMAALILVIAGLANVASMSTFNIAGQSMLPDWVRGRGLAVVQLTFMLALATGGAVWGALAAAIGVTSTLQVAAVCLAATSMLGWAFRLAAAESVDATLAEQPEPYVPVTLSPDDGPVLLSVEYRVPADSVPEFLAGARHLARVRKREGALHWGLYADPNDPQRLVETFIAPSWSEHLRTATRLTATDARIISRARALHHGDDEPKLVALLAVKDLDVERARRIFAPRVTEMPALVETAEGRPEH